MPRANILTGSSWGAAAWQEAAELATPVPGAAFTSNNPAAVSTRLLAAPLPCQGHTRTTKATPAPGGGTQGAQHPSSGLDTPIQTLQGILPGMEGVFKFSEMLSHLGTEDFGPFADNQGELPAS